MEITTIKTRLGVIGTLIYYVICSVLLFPFIGILGLIEEWKRELAQLRRVWRGECGRYRTP
jgi:hypothetical protein